MIKLEQFKIMFGQDVIAQIPELVVNRNDKLLVVGGNGSGKTTLLKSIAGLHRETAGGLQVESSRQGMTFVHQEPVMFQGSVRDNIVYGLKVRRIGKQETSVRLNSWASKLGVHAFLARDAQTLSGGEKKKVALIRALIIQPELLLIDEPLSELDDEASLELIDLILGLENSTVVATTPIYDGRFKSFTRFELSSNSN